MNGYGSTTCEARRMGLAASVQVRLDATRRITKAMQDNDPKLYSEGVALHKYGEKVARIYRSA